MSSSVIVPQRSSHWEASRHLSDPSIEGENTDMNKRVLFVIPLLALTALFLSSCAPGINQLQNVPIEGETVAGFWQGLWHGIIVPFTFLISLFRPDVAIYEVHNNGAWYNFGFIIGAGILLGGGHGASRRRG